MNLSNYGENLLLNYILNSESATRPTAWYVGLFSDAAGLTADQPSTEISGNGYSRRGVTFGPSVGGVASNTNVITFSATGTWTPVTYTGIFDASSSGNLLFWAPLQTAISLSNGGQIIFAINTITATMN
jgi:hypothetical protein